MTTVLVPLTAAPVAALPSVISAEFCVDATGFEFDVVVSEPDQSRNNLIFRIGGDSNPFISPVERIAANFDQTGALLFTPAVQSSGTPPEPDRWQDGNLNIVGDANRVLDVTVIGAGVFNVTGRVPNGTEPFAADLVVSEINFRTATGSTTSLANISVGSCPGVTPEADLSVTKTDNVAPATAVEVGDQINYTITVANNGPDNATGVVVTDTLPPEVTFNFNGGPCNTVGGSTNMIQCAPVDIAAGSATNFTITTTATTATVAGATATNSATGTGNETDPDTNNNTATANTVINDPPTTGTIIIEKVAQPADGSGFTFVGDVAGTIDDGGQIVVSGLPADSYLSSELPTQGWRLYSIDCDDAGSATPSVTNVSTSTGMATVNLDPAETVTCTFTNRQVQIVVRGIGRLPGGTVPRLRPGSSLTESYGGYVPGSRVRLWAQSDPILIDEQIADVDGEVSFDFELPSELEAGLHELIVQGPSSDGESVLEYVSEFEVIAEPECTIEGTTGNDWLVGTNGADVICGLGGHDVIFGLGGDDLLIGDEGNDILFGNGGADVLIGADGNDWLFGGRKADLLFGEGGNDRIFGGSGPDELDGGEGNDTLRGGFGDDILLGGADTDTLSGGPGNDIEVQ